MKGTIPKELDSLVYVMPWSYSYNKDEILKGQDMPISFDFIA